MLLRIVGVFAFVFFGQLAKAQERQSDPKLVNCKYEPLDKPIWDFDAKDSLQLVISNCEIEKQKVMLFNRWGQVLIEENTTVITKEMFEDRPAAGSYFGNFEFLNEEGIVKKYSLVLVIR
ncbi:MAG: hypothetical protein JXQ87_08130 [Bacteroidia bacterium]